jgi:hypothetical protein
MKSFASFQQTATCEQMAKDAQNEAEVRTGRRGRARAAALDVAVEQAAESDKPLSLREALQKD